MNRSDILRDMALRSFVKEAFNPNADMNAYLDSQAAAAEQSARDRGIKNEADIKNIKAKARQNAEISFNKAKQLHGQGLKDPNLLEYLQNLQNQGQDIRTYGTRTTTNLNREQFKKNLKARGISEDRAEELATSNFPDSSQKSITETGKIPETLKRLYSQKYYDKVYNDQKAQLGDSTKYTRFLGRGIDSTSADYDRQKLLRDYESSGKLEEDIRTNAMPQIVSSRDPRYSNIHGQLVGKELKYTADPNTAAGQYGFIPPEELNAYLSDATRTSLPGLNMPRDKAVSELSPIVSRYTKAMSGGEGTEDDITREQLIQELSKDNDLSRQIYSPLMNDTKLTEQQRQSLLAEGAEAIRRRRSDAVKQQQEAAQAKIPSFTDRLQNAGQARLDDIGNKLINFVSPQAPAQQPANKTEAPVTPAASESQDSQQSTQGTDYAYDAGSFLNNIIQGGGNLVDSFNRGLGANKQAPAQQAPVQQAPVQQAPAQQAPAQQAPAQQAFQVGRLRGGYYDLAKQLSKQTGTSYSGAQLAKAFGNKMLRQGDKIDLGSLAANKGQLLNADISKRKALSARPKPAVAPVANPTNNAVAKAPVKSYQAIPETKLQLGANTATPGFSFASNTTNTAPTPMASTTPKQQPQQFDEDLD